MSDHVRLNSWFKIWNGIFEFVELVLFGSKNRIIKRDFIAEFSAAHENIRVDDIVVSFLKNRNIANRTKKDGIYLFWMGAGSQFWGAIPRLNMELLRIDSNSVLYSYKVEVFTKFRWAALFVAGMASFVCFIGLGLALLKALNVDFGNEIASISELMIMSGSSLGVVLTIGLLFRFYRLMFYIPIKKLSSLADSFLFRNLKS